MTRHVSIVLARLVGTFLTVWFGFAWLVEPWRVVEADGISWILSFLGVSGVRAGFGNDLLVLPDHGAPFLAVISPSCSALAAVLAFAAIAIFLTSGSMARRTVAFTGAATLVVAANFLRIAASVWVGLDLGRESLVTFHDWVGTTVGIIGVLLAFALFLFLLLPSHKILVREVLRAR